VDGQDGRQGPFFKVTNKSPSTILYGKIAVYFYDKRKQLDVMDTAATRPSRFPTAPAPANLQRRDEARRKATIQFSCVKKEHVPEGTAAIEAEMQTVGFRRDEKRSTSTGPTDLVPDARKKAASSSGSGLEPRADVARLLLELLLEADQRSLRGDGIDVLPPPHECRREARSRGRGGAGRRVRPALAVLARRGALRVAPRHAPASVCG